MSIQVIDNFRAFTNKLLDERSGPYETKAAALAALSANDRGVGLQVYVVTNPIVNGAGAVIGGDSFVRYVFNEGIDDVHLVEDSGPGSTGVFDPKLPDGTLSTVKQGAYDIGTDMADLRGKPYDEVLTNMFVELILASYTPKSYSLNGLNNQVLEIGDSLTINLTGVFSAGRITNGDGSPGPALVGPPTQYDFTPPGGGTQVPGGDTFSEVHEVVAGSQQWTSSVLHDPGTGSYTDNLGNPDTSLDPLRVDGTIVDTSGTITGVYPFLVAYNATAIPGGVALYNAAVAGGQKLNETKSNKTVILNTTGNFVHFAYPATHGDLSAIFDQNGFNVTSSFTKTTVVVESSGLANDWNTSYNIYTTNAPTTIVSGSYQFNF